MKTVDVDLVSEFFFSVATRLCGKDALARMTTILSTSPLATDRERSVLYRILSLIMAILCPTVYNPEYIA